ncbi:PAS domain-containing protein/anti-sigma regulatory factor (Ser/Thr protein kinase) [Streptomyces sp. SAI-135]|uniref:SpoIIE family protein phosphatase/ATP-binding protein n=1 Tax=unclassified Streptomyces TaxID=2593676 RepID=UPI002473DA90|nr:MULTISPECIES: SpoIIE family protein phosphatase/ATP-binding protein [unclassified Streptomyces]MDH6514489.1 PAS domain-containing protein/anti-sigma regulatory factor (Ser/Thr protein kinase) [Streptomyces sp. SAI-090]MDH6589309.1 PAS domain-containing protein/anti-sigma regulatory factor (Ser/Thr protein kinase) [Streptomyces sp. SAI-133]MDH6621428.1 PAS domain-containing protein/anti-sigma regulatory factor (Ser/Thr protein kinase) [Streptomyces sp. SAI-135]
MVRLPGRFGGGSARRPGGPRPAQTPDHPHDRHEAPLKGSSPTRVERDGSPERRRPGALRAAVGGRSVAGQVFVLQVVIVLLLVVAAVVALVLQVRHDSTVEARNRSVAVAQAFANAPGTVEALKSPDPSAVLQPRAEAARRATDVDFIVVMDTDGIRYTHPKPDRIGKKFVGDIAPALAGRVVTEDITGTIGPLVQAVVPIKDDGKVVGLVSAGITTAKVGGTADEQLPLLLMAAAVGLALATGGTALVSRRLLRQTHGLGPHEMTRMYEHHDAVLHAVREGVLIVGGEGRLLLANDEAHRLLDLPADAEGRHVRDLALPADTALLLASGRVATDEVHRVKDRLLAVNQRPTDIQGGPPGSVATLRDSTELRALSGRAEVARERLDMLYDATVGIGTSLDVTRTAEELAELAVPRFADFATVDLFDAVLSGGQPEAATTLRRTALSGIREDAPLFKVGERIPLVDSAPQARGISSGRAVLEPRLAEATGWHAQDRERSAHVMEYGIHSLIAVPLRAGNLVLGTVSFWRSDKPQPFDTEEVALAEELVTRAAVSIDNARRYTREHTMAVTLQRSLLPRRLPEQDALDIAYKYLPAQAGVGGDWFDVLPLSGARVALVVGDVVGHGLHAAATMGRLRTAVHNFSALDLPPDELLALLDELVARIDQDEAEESGNSPVTGATCLYAVYDPVSRLCTIARAGHPPPALIHPDGSVEYPDVPAGPPLGLGGLPFETADLELAEGSRLVLYTDGLVEDRERDIDVGLELLRTALEQAGPSPEDTCRTVLDARPPARATDDIALIVARTRALGADRIAEWQVPADPAAVSDVRAAVTRQLARWDLDDLAFATELILSELVTNAIRYGGDSIHVRVLFDRTLICEVFDTSSTSPHLRYAAMTDEGGRGLFLVAQLSERWGTRYTPAGKVIWAEQPLP